MSNQVLTAKEYKEFLNRKPELLINGEIENIYLNEKGHKNITLFTKFGKVKLIYTGDEELNENDSVCCKVASELREVRQTFFDKTTKQQSSFKVNAGVPKQLLSFKKVFI